MPSHRILAIACGAACFWTVAVEGRGQAPLVLPRPPAQSPPAPEVTEPSRVLQGNYRRPSFSLPLFKVEELPLSGKQIDELVHQLALLARDFPNDRRVSLDCRAKGLAIALRLRPEDRDCSVANGQLARGIQPLALNPEAPTPLEHISVPLLNTSMDLLKLREPTARILGIHLLDLASELDPANREVFDLFVKSAPAVNWKGLLEPNRAGPDYLEEESADLHLPKASLLMLLRNGGGIRPQPVRISATAVKLDDGSRKPMQLAMPEAVRAAQEAELPKLRSLLRNRWDAWPAGWRIDVDTGAADPPQQPGVLLGMGLIVEAMIAGEPLDEACLSACGLNAETGTTKSVCDFETLLTVCASAGPENVIIMAGGSDEEIADFLVLNPARLMDLASLTLCEARNFSECVALSHAQRPAALQRSLEQFAAVAAAIRKGGLPVLRSPQTVKELEAVLQLNPNLVSARFLNQVAQKRHALNLSSNGSYRTLNRLGTAILHAPGDPSNLGRWNNRLEQTPFAQAKMKIDRIRPLLHAKSRAYADALCDLSRIYDAFMLNPPQTPQLKADIMKSIRDVRRRLTAAAEKQPSP